MGRRDAARRNKACAVRGGLRRGESIGMETETRLEIVKVVWPEEEWQPLIREDGRGRTGGEAGEA